MPRADVPSAVVQFVLNRIDSVAELEALLIMAGEEQSEWSVHDIAVRIYLDTPSASAVLRALQKHRLITADEPGTRFRFKPADEDERQTILLTAAAYRTFLIPITTLIHKKASGAVHEFARAFSLKKDE